MLASSEFWERPEVVARFAGRDPDDRLEQLVRDYRRPRDVRVLDAGCAGGRNTLFLARRGYDVHALDASRAMVTETRRRLAGVVGEAEAHRRVRPGRMDDLSSYSSGTFDLVVSLGLLHNAGSWAEWKKAVAETARVLARRGRLLVSQFTPRTDRTGRGSRPVPGEPHVYEGALRGRPGVLLEPAEMDAGMARVGLRPETPTVEGVTERERGRRVSAKGLYRKESES